MTSTTKAILCGSASVGKTTLLQRLSGCYKNMTPEPTMGASFSNVSIPYQDKMLSINFWDTAGQETYASLIKIYFKHASIVIVVFDLTSRKSFEQIPYWFDEIEKNRTSEKPAGIVVGNKADKAEIQITDDEISTLASEYGVEWLKVSATNGDGVQVLLQKVASLAIITKADPNAQRIHMPTKTEPTKEAAATATEKHDEAKKEPNAQPAEVPSAAPQSVVPSPPSAQAHPLEQAASPQEPISERPEPTPLDINPPKKEDNGGRSCC